MTDDLLYTRFDNIFFEKTRLSIMTLLYKEELVSFNRLKKVIGTTDGALYSHLQKLQDSEYILFKKEVSETKPQTYYFLSKKGKKVFQSYIKFLEKMISK